MGVAGGAWLEPLQSAAVAAAASVTGHGPIAMGRAAHGLPQPDFFLTGLFDAVPPPTSATPISGAADTHPSMASWQTTLVLYFVPLAMLVWIMLRVRMHHSQEAAEATARPAHSEEGASPEADERARARALPPLIAYATTHILLVFWYRGVLLGDGPAPPVAGVGWLAALTCPPLLLGAVALSVAAHRVVTGARTLTVDAVIAG